MIALAIGFCATGCVRQQPTETTAEVRVSPTVDAKATAPLALPYPPDSPSLPVGSPDADVLQPGQIVRTSATTGHSDDPTSIATNDIPLFGANSPFDEDFQTPQLKKEKLLWADSWLYAKAPEFVVGKWLSEEPDTKGKYVLVEFWATWCGPCRRSIPLLNRLHKKYGEELVVIGVSDEKEEEVRKLAEKDAGAPPIEYYSAVDTQARMKTKLGVWGVPHVVILEPDGYVVWEGFPLQEDYELTDDIIERILEVGRKLQAAKTADRTAGGPR